MTWLDKALAYVAPGAALKREEARQRLAFLNSGYSHHGGNTRKKGMLDWDGESRSPREDINDNLPLLRERSRDLYMGGANIATGAIQTMRTNVVGSGLVLRPSPDAAFLGLKEDQAEQWAQTVAREFRYYADSVQCDRFRMNNFYELQQLALLSMLLSGDVLVLLPYRRRAGFLYDLRIQLVEGDRIATPPEKLGDPDISQGVEVKNGEVTAYYVLDRHPGSLGFDRRCQRVEAYGAATGRRNALHLMESERPDQTRGVPMLAPVMEALRQLGKYTVAELNAAVVSGLFTVTVTTEAPENEGAEGEYVPGGVRVDDSGDESLEMGYGSVHYLHPGEKIQTAAPGRPNVAFEGFMTAITRYIGAALGLPYELLIKHFSASYSASRAALLEAWKLFRTRRAWFANDFCQPVYEEWLAEAVAKGRVAAPGFFEDPILRAAYSRAEWHGPSQGQIDPLKEVNAAARRIAEGLSTRQKEAAELTGTDFNDNHRQLVKEERMRGELGRGEGGMENGELRVES
jgi:lambda family phage portal protein